MSPGLSFAISFLALATASSALAQAAAAPAAGPAAPAANFTLPRAYQGYSQPEITQCATTGDSRRQCVVPAMTAGRYVIAAQGSATATGADGVQALEIAVGGQVCAALKSALFSGKKSLPPVACRVSLLTDAPITITALFAVQRATADPGGPQLVVQRVPWNGVVDAREITQRPAPPAPPAKQ